jgi:hypothetical protein
MKDFVPYPEALALKELAFGFFREKFLLKPIPKQNLLASKN